jgi:tetratricopeptide (TPR) repeat protein
MKHFWIRALLLLAVLIPAAAPAQVADDAMSLARRAWQLQQAGDYAGAVDAYRAFLKLRPNEPAALSNLGAALAKLGRFDEAIAEYQKAEKLLPGDARIGMNLALAYEKSGRTREASEKLAALHAQAPQERQITLLLADCELQLGDYDRVIELLQPVERENPSDLATAYMLGTALIRTQRIAEGQVLLDRILKNGDSAEARFLLGTQLFQSGDYPAAVKELASAIELNPKLPELQSYYGLALLNTGDPVGASAAFRRELAKNPNDYTANLGLGQILVFSKKYGEAMPFIQTALRRRPESLEAGLALGECLSGTGKLPEARKRLEAVARALPASLEAHRELLSVYTRLHLRAEAARERATVRRLEREAAAKQGGPAIDALAPDFDLPEVGTKRQVRLSAMRGEAPVVLVFGSYSCPNLRGSAVALNALFQRYGRQARFLLIYIREAHATGSGEWQSTRNEREGVVVPPARTIEDKEDHAAMCTRELHLRFPALVDGMDGKVEAAYAAWPSRVFVIGADGRVRYSTGLSQQDFHAKEMESALRAAIGSPGVSRREGASHE